MIISFLKQEMIISQSFLSYVLLNYFSYFSAISHLFHFYFSKKNFPPKRKTEPGKKRYGYADCLRIISETFNCLTAVGSPGRAERLSSLGTRRPDRPASGLD